MAQIDKLVQKLKSTPKTPDKCDVGGYSLSVDKLNTVLPDVNLHSVAFIDGGQGDIMTTPTFCLSILRICSVRYKMLKAVSALKTSFYIIVRREGKKYLADVTLIEDEIGLGTEIEKLAKSTISTKLASDAVSQFRRWTEILCAKKMASVIETGGILVLDGHLETCTPEEKRIMLESEKEIESKGVLLTGLSKSTSIASDDGHSVTSVLADVPGCWYHNPIKLGDKLLLSFVRLHKSSEFVFKFETLSGEGNIDFQRIVATLAAHSKDPVFPGYPYGLIKADKIARISREEVSYQKSVVVSKLGDSWSSLRRRLDLPDAHAILDSIG